MGYTHEDINGTYRRSSAKIKKKDIFSLLQMVKTYRCEDHNLFISYLINYKGGEKYWHPMITYWENILNDLVIPFMINQHSSNNF